MSLERLLGRATRSFNTFLQTEVAQLLATGLRVDPLNLPDHLLHAVAGNRLRALLAVSCESRQRLCYRT